jgi:hypothetical protein
MDECLLSTAQGDFAQRNAGSQNRLRCHQVDEADLDLVLLISAKIYRQPNLPSTAPFNTTMVHPKQ